MDEDMWLVLKITGHLSAIVGLITRAVILICLLHFAHKYW